MEECWYRDGLRFECTRCGRCCRGAGNVWVSDAEIEALAARVGMPEDEFRRTHTRRARRGGISLRQKRNQDCVFWRAGEAGRGGAEAGCEVYEDRPRQCRSYPFWSANLHSRENWDAEAAACPGIGHGKLVPADEIAREAADDGIPRDRTRLRVEGS